MNNNYDLSRIVGILNEEYNLSHIEIDDLINILNFTKYYQNVIKSYAIKYKNIVRQIYFSDDNCLTYSILFHNNNISHHYLIKFKNSEIKLILPDNEIIVFADCEILIEYFNDILYKEIYHE